MTAGKQRKRSLRCRVAAWWKRVHLLVLLAVGVLALALGFHGFWLFSLQQNLAHTFFDTLYLSLQLFGLESGYQGEIALPWTLNLARFLAPVVTIYALISTVARIFNKEFRNRRQSKLKEHVVICGMGRKSVTLVRNFLDANKSVVIIESDPDNPLPERLEDPRVYIIYGDATDGETLRTARALHAGYVVASAGDDSTNIDIAAQLFSLVADTDPPATPIQCYVHLTDADVLKLFKDNVVFHWATEAVAFHVFNVHEQGARLLAQQHLLTMGPADPGDPGRLHVVIGGLGVMGEALCLQLAQSAHYANERKTAVTIVDLDANHLKHRLKHKYPALDTLCDLDFMQGDLQDISTLCAVSKRADQKDERTAIVLCTDHDYGNFSIALQLVPLQQDPTTQIYIRLSTAEGIADLIRSETSDSALAARVEGFGMLGDCCTRDQLLHEGQDKFAKALHEAYASYRIRQGENTNQVVLRPWNTLPEMYRESNRQQANHMVVKLHTLGWRMDGETEPGLEPLVFSEEQVELLARVEHTRWCAERLLAGWSYADGPKDENARTHPDLVPWGELSARSQEFDRVAVQAIPEVLRLAGFGLTKC